METADSTLRSERAPRMDRGDRYVYQKSTERSNPDVTRTARQIHGRSYIAEGFLRESALDEYGQVAEDIDKARGDAVEYYVGTTPDGEPVSTLRAIKATTAEGFEGLPGYQLCEDVLSDEAREFLQAAQEAGRPIKEISSLGHVPEVRPTAGVELIRHAIHESYETGDIWFCALVTSKYKALVHRLGPRAVRKAGDEVQFNDERISDGVSLTPTLVDVATFFDDITGSMLEAGTTKRRRELLLSLKSFASGVDPERLSDNVRIAIGEADEFSMVEHAQAKHVRSSLQSWSQPLQLDLSDRFDKLYAKKLIDDGRVRTLLDPAWHDEFPEIGNSEGDGSWFFYPWSESLVHFPDKADYRSMRHIRDRHLVTEEEQARLLGKSSLYAGLSVGSHVLEHMVYAGVTDAHYLADFDTISVSNLNRIHAGMPQVGERKVDAVAKKVSELDPYTKQTLLSAGITFESLDGLEEVPAIIFDEVDDFAAKALLRVYAKEKKVPLIMATDVGYKTIIDIERHDLEATRPFNGRIHQDTLDTMLFDDLTGEEQLKERRKITTQIVGLSNASFRLLQSLDDPSLRGLPQLEVTASQGGALATIVARDILLGRKVPSGRHVYDARRAMKLPGETSLAEGVKTLRQFLAKR